MFGALAFSTYQIAAAFHPFSSLIIRALHVSFLVMLIFMFYPATEKGRRQNSIPLVRCASIIGFGAGFYHLLFEGDLIERSGILAWLTCCGNHCDRFSLKLRRVVGWALTLVCATFLAYGFFGQYLPLSIAHRGFGYDQIVSQLYLGSDGILGVPTLVSATYIFLFILFGIHFWNMQA